MVWGFDSFEGFPAPSLQDQSIRKAKKGDAWKECSITTVHEMLTLSGLDPHYVESRIMLVKGFFEQTLSEYDRQPIALLHLDVDLYASYKECLVKLYPLMASGGIIAFDEYKRGLEPIYWPGAAKAIEEFLGDRVRHIQRDPVTGKYYIECGEYINQTASPLRGETGKTRGL